MFPAGMPHIFRLAGRKSSQRNVAVMADLRPPSRGRARVAMAAATGLITVVSTAAGPARAETPLDTPLDTPSWVQEGIRSAMTRAKDTGNRIKIEDATTEFAEYYATPDGKITGKISPDMQRFSRDGSWVPIDLTLRKQADGSVAPAAYPKELKISGARAGKSGDLVAVGSDDEKVVMGWQGALPDPVLDGSKATYPAVMPGVDLVIQVTRTGFEQFAILKSAAAAKYADEITLPLSGPGVSVVRGDKKDRVQIHSRGGESRATIPTPMMWDSRSEKHGGPQRRRQVAMDIAHTASAQARKGVAATDAVNLTLKPDQKWLTSPDTVYPVTIDPYYDWSTTVTSTTVVKDQATGWPDSDSLFMGKYDNTWTARSFISWWATGLQGYQVDQATLHLANPYSTTCSQTPWEIWTTDPITATTSWANQPEWVALEATSTSTSCTDGWVTADATSFFQRAVEKEVGQPTMGLRAADETATNQYKQFWSWKAADSSKAPFAEVWYSLPPNPVDPDAALWATQTTLTDFRDWTLAEVGANSGYLDSINDATTTSVTLLWAGAPNAMQAAVLAEAQRRTITATVVQRQYTRSQHEQAETAAWASANSGTGVFANFTIGGSEAVPAGFDGLIIRGQHTSNPADTAAADLALSQQATQALGIPVQVNTAPMPTFTATKRSLDTPAFNAGALFSYPYGSTRYVCSTSWGVKIGSSTYAATARHCGMNPMRRYDDTAAGAKTYASKQLAGGATRLLNVGGSRLMFTGGHASTSKVQVVGTYKVTGKGDFVCTSGGNSGSHCGSGAHIKIIGDTKADDGFGDQKFLWGRRSDSGLAVAGGDSGGPVYRNATSTTVYAVGVIQGGFEDVAPCGSVRVDTSSCLRDVFFTPVWMMLGGVSGGTLNEY
jgi:hypothetical protein